MQDQREVLPQIKHVDQHSCHTHTTVTVFQATTEHKKNLTVRSVGHLLYRSAFHKLEKASFIQKEPWMKLETN